MSTPLAAIYAGSKRTPPNSGMLSSSFNSFIGGTFAHKANPNALPVSKKLYCTGAECLKRAYYFAQRTAEEKKEERRLRSLDAFQRDMDPELSARVLDYQQLHRLAGVYDSLHFRDSTVSVKEESMSRRAEKTRAALQRHFRDANPSTPLSIHDATFAVPNEDGIEMWATLDFLHYLPAGHKPSIGSASSEPSWEINEVKSFLELKNIKKVRLVNDLAFQVYCLSLCGIEVSHTNILHVSRTHYRTGVRFGADPAAKQLHRIFTTSAITSGELACDLPDTLEKVAQIQNIAVTGQNPNSLLTGNVDPLTWNENFESANVKQMSSVTAQPSLCGPQCTWYGCDYSQRCIPTAKVMPNSVFTVPGLKMEKRTELWNVGRKKASEVLDKVTKKPAVKLSEKASRYCLSCLEDRPIVDVDQVKTFLSSLRYPLVFLDFETVSYAISPWDKVAAWDQVPFQYSMHVAYTDVLREQELDHFEFVHLGSGVDSTEDPRLKLSTSLMLHLNQVEKNAKTKCPAACKAIQEEAALLNQKKRKAIETANIGTIVCHNAAFEKKVLHQLTLFDSSFPAKYYVDKLNFADTLDLSRNALTLPQAEGSFSIKKLLPALALDKELAEGYASDRIDSGTKAAAAFKVLTYQKGKVSPAQVTKLRRDLLDYCEKDTLAMVEVLRGSYALAEPSYRSEWQKLIGDSSY